MMPFNAIVLKPGVNSQMTQSANQAGVSLSQCMRYKDGMLQALGGWVSWGLSSPSTVRDLHAWQTLAGNQYMGIGATKNLAIIHNTTGVDTFADITPQTITNTSTGITFSITAGSNQVSVTDANSGASVYNIVYFNTPVTLGSVFLSGAYPIQVVLSTGSYTINASANSSQGQFDGGVQLYLQHRLNPDCDGNLLGDHEQRSAPACLLCDGCPTGRRFRLWGRWIR